MSERGGAVRPSWLDLNAGEGPEDVCLPVEVRVKQGMAALDAKYGPEWVNRIDVGTLNVAGYCTCVLAQVHGGDYSVGFAVCAPTGQPDWSFDNGFYDPTQKEYPALTIAWRHAILARRLEQA